MAVSVLDPSVIVGVIFALFFLPMVLEVYAFGKNLKKEPLGTFFEYLFLSYIVTVFAELWEWYSLRYGVRTLNNFKMITKLCLDIGIVILYIVGIIGLFVNVGFYIKTLSAGASIIVLLLSIFWKIAYNFFEAHREVGTPTSPRELENGLSRAHCNNASRSSSSSLVTLQTSSPQRSRQLENGDMGSNNGDESVSNNGEIDVEAQPTMQNQLATPPSEMIFQGPYARINKLYRWVIMLLAKLVGLISSNNRLKLEQWLEAWLACVSIIGDCGVGEWKLVSK